MKLELRGKSVVDVSSEHTGGEDAIGITTRGSTASIATTTRAHPHHEAQLIAVATDVGEACVVGVVEATE